MRTFRNLVSFYIMLGFALLNTKAQVPYKMSYQTAVKVSSLSVDTFSMTYGWANTPLINCPITKETRWPWITTYHNYSFFITNEDQYYSLFKPIIFGYSWTPIAWKPLTRLDLENTGAYYFKDTRITWNRTNDSAIVFFYPLKRTDEPILSDCFFYRTSAFIFMGMVQFKYPGAFGHPKYPQAYTIPTSIPSNKSEK